LLKPIVKVPKVIVAFLTLLKLVKLAKTIIVLREVVCSVVLLFLRFIDVERELVRGLVRLYGRPNRGSWRPFFRQWYAGGTKEMPYVPSDLR
jgi:hypothetical protein